MVRISTNVRIEPYLEVFPEIEAESLPRRDLTSIEGETDLELIYKNIIKTKVTKELIFSPAAQYHNLLLNRTFLEHPGHS